MDGSKRWLMLAVVLAACSSDARSPAPRAGVAIVRSAPPADARVDVDAANDVVIVAEMSAFASARIAARAPAVEAPFDTIAAFGPCQRPTPDQMAALTRRVDAWITRTNRGAHRAEGAQESVRFGCIEPDGIVLDLQADLTFARRRGVPYERRAGRWWVVRATATEFAVLAHAAGCAIDDCMEWSGIHSVHTLGLVDVDGDGGFEPIVWEAAYEGGARPEGDVRVVRRRGVQALLHLRGYVNLEPGLGAPAVLAIDEDDGPIFRCITDVGTTGDCPAAIAAAHRHRQVEALSELSNRPAQLLAERERLARLLDRLEAPAAERARWLAAARPSSLPSLVTDFADQRLHARAERTRAERADAARTSQAERGAELRAAIGDAPCDPGTPAQRRAALAQIRRWIRARERGSQVPTLTAGCVGAGAAYWHATWLDVPRDPDAVEAHARAALFYLSGARPRVIAESSTPLENSEDGWLPVDAGPTLAVKLFTRDGAIGAVTRTGDRALAVIDGVVTGTLDGASTLDWAPPYDVDLDDFIPLDDTLIMTVDALGTSSFAHATPRGFEVVAQLDPPDLAAAPPAGPGLAATIDHLRRLDRAEAFIGQAYSPGIDPVRYRAQVLTALELLGASPELLATAATATIP